MITVLHVCGDVLVCGAAACVLITMFAITFRVIGHVWNGGS